MSNPERWAKFRALSPDIKQKLDRLIPLFEQEGVELAYLFGSLSRGKAGHDLDLAILINSKPVFTLRTAIMNCLAEERLDLVDLDQASPVLRFEIVRTGQLLYAQDAAVEEAFVLSTLRQYKDTAWLRRRQNAHLKERMKRWSSGQNLSNNA